jgi:hypothetical protein
MSEERRKEGLFLALVAQLDLAARVSLGLRENPTTGEKETPDLPTARFQIDMLGVLEEKTRGRLSPREAQALEAALTDLRLLYVEAADRQAKAAGEKSGGSQEGGEGGKEGKKEGAQA